MDFSGISFTFSLLATFLGMAGILLGLAAVFYCIQEKHEKKLHEAETDRFLEDLEEELSKSPTEIPVVPNYVVLTPTSSPEDLGLILVDPNGVRMPVTSIDCGIEDGGVRYLRFTMGSPEEDDPEWGRGYTWEDDE